MQRKDNTMKLSKNNKKNSHATFPIPTLSICVNCQPYLQKFATLSYLLPRKCKEKAKLWKWKIKQQTTRSRSNEYQHTLYQPSLTVLIRIHPLLTWERRGRDSDKEIAIKRDKRDCVISTSLSILWTMTDKKRYFRFASAWSCPGKCRRLDPVKWIRMRLGSRKLMHERFILASLFYLFLGESENTCMEFWCLFLIFTLRRGKKWCIIVLMLVYFIVIRVVKVTFGVYGIAARGSCAQLRHITSDVVIGVINRREIGVTKI